MIKNLYCFFCNKKKLSPLILNYRGAGERVHGGRGKGGLSKRNVGDILFNSNN